MNTWTTVTMDWWKLLSNILISAFFHMNQWAREATQQGAGLPGQIRKNKENRLDSTWSWARFHHQIVPDRKKVGRMSPLFWVKQLVSPSFSMNRLEIIFFNWLFFKYHQNQQNTLNKQWTFLHGSNSFRLNVLLFNPVENFHPTTNHCFCYALLYIQLNVPKLGT